MSNPPYRRLDDAGLQKVFEKMKALGNFAYQDNASGLYTPEGTVEIETTSKTLREETKYTLNGENLVITLGDQVNVITDADATFKGTEGNISVT